LLGATMFSAVNNRGWSDRSKGFRRVVRTDERGSLQNVVSDLLW